LTVPGLAASKVFLPGLFRCEQRQRCASHKRNMPKSISTSWRTRFREFCRTAETIVVASLSNGSEVPDPNVDVSLRTVGHGPSAGAVFNAYQSSAPTNGMAPRYDICEQFFFNCALRLQYVFSARRFPTKPVDNVRRVDRRPAISIKMFVLPSNLDKIINTGGHTPSPAFPLLRLAAATFSDTGSNRVDLVPEPDLRPPKPHGLNRPQRVFPRTPFPNNTISIKPVFPR